MIAMVLRLRSLHLLSNSLRGQILPGYIYSVHGHGCYGWVFFATAFVNVLDQLTAARRGFFNLSARVKFLRQSYDRYHVITRPWVLQYTKTCFTFLLLCVVVLATSVIAVRT